MTRIKLYTSVFCLLLIVAANAQKVFFEQLTTAEGLPSDYVNLVYEDSKGFLWIATDKGVCRYDGREFKLFNRDNGLPDNFVICLAEDNQGQVWMGTYAGGICKFDGNEIISLPYDKPGFPKHIRQIHFNKDNSFLVITIGSEVYYFRNETSTPKKLTIKLGEIARLSENRFLSDSKHGYHILRRIDDTIVIEDDKELNAQVDLVKPHLSQDKFLVRQGNELALFDIEENSLRFRKNLHVQLRWPTWEIKDYDVDSNKILIGSTHGLIYIDEQGHEFLFGSENGLGSDYINHIARDRRGNVYICTFGAGIKLWKEPYLRSIDINGKITSIFPDQEKLYFTSTQNNYEYSLSSQKLTSYYKLDRGNFTSIYRAPDGSIYIGSLVDFYRLPNESAWRQLNESNKEDYLRLANQGTSGFSFKHKKMYVGTYGDGIMTFDAKGRLLDTIKIPNGMVEALVPLSKSIAALTFSIGVVLIDSLNNIKTISKEQGMLSNTVHSVFEDKEGSLWIGTLSGVNRFEGNRVTQTYSFNEGFIGSMALCIFRDRLDRLCVLSDKVLHIMDDHRLRAIRSHPVLLNARDAINRAIYDQNTDQLYIGLTNALMIVDIGKIKPIPSIETPALFSVVSDSSSINFLQSKFSIPQKSKRISFRFVDAHKQFNAHSDILYKLEPFDEDWKLLDNSLEAVYQKVPPGNYRFLAKSVNADGYPSAITNLATFEVLPPYWKRGWFIAAVASVLLAIFYLSGHFISRYRYKQRLKDLQSKFQLQLERERIARELHDNVGSQLTYLINKIDDDHASLINKKEANELSNFARGTMRELRETIWALNNKEVALQELEQKIRQLARLHKDAHQSVEVNWEVNGIETSSFNPIKALNIYRVIQEALNNAGKYSGATQVSVRIEQLEKHFHVTVTDNGKGFDPAQAIDGYGLKNMQKRALEMNSELSVESELQKGTTVSLKIPNT